MNTGLMKMIKSVFFSCFFLISLALVITESAQKPCPECGGKEVPYPLSTAADCGDPRYNISCNRTTGRLEFVSAYGLSYSILSTNPANYRFIIQPPPINDSCQTRDLGVGGLKIDEGSPFNISTRNTVMLFNCSETIKLSPLNCSDNSPCRVFEAEAVGGRACKNTLCCSYLKDSAMTSHYIRIRNGGCSAYTSFVDVKPGEQDITKWNSGIELQWQPPN
ncbi:wall-associated receptor kinase-like 20 [Malania oleifera]|uniref:wall-associated receptor kinase-like 20 n=1 Tax=Malania oleifera TaxID=397392 RepID=UPI0025AE5F4D|nr:wall-associated receptor kinase-like 20 [Malania oleifera]